MMHVIKKWGNTTCPDRRTLTRGPRHNTSTGDYTEGSRYDSRCVTAGVRGAPREGAGAH